MILQNSVEIVNILAWGNLIAHICVVGVPHVMHALIGAIRLPLYLVKFVFHKFIAF